MWCKVCSLFPGLVNESGDRSTDLNMLAPGINKRHDDLDNNGRLPEPAPKQRNGHWQMHYGFKSQLMVRHESTKQHDACMRAAVQAGYFPALCRDRKCLYSVILFV